MPELQAAADARDDFDLVTVLVHGNPRRAEAAARSRNLTAPVLIDDGSLRAKFRVKRTPTTVLLDRDGRAVRMFVGAQSRDSIERALDDVN